MNSILRIGDVGRSVTDLQRALGVLQDGHFGPATRSAVIAFQRSQGLVQDGVAGPKTLAALFGRRDPRHLSQRDLQQAADALGVPIASVMAVNYVESRGSGFLDDRPVILFERHVMYRRCLEYGLDVENLCVRYPALVNPKRGGYEGGAREHVRLDIARGIHPAAAIESASWGLFQIMGFHWKRLGYESAADFAEAMRHSEGTQLDAFVRFISSDAKLHGALVVRDWPEFARMYNGPAYRENLYDVKLERAFEQFSGVK